eukprot:CAMPEP_0185265876 /NCGR_PEP_ID=MMETSP1359-20130426/29143_1 /TAXON_ID=552665 /ORGANISM="Bigelowiella longifila, Strain CCMP242" /LENGTH=71 /DNA_ID=CAMNT_0027855405 /DNA_START=270 /DNA_END=485 /DNA_ORIENTATION=+
MTRIQRKVEVPVPPQQVKLEGNPQAVAEGWEILRLLNAIQLPMLSMKGSLGFRSPGKGAGKGARGVKLVKT